MVTGDGDFLRDHFGAQHLEGRRTDRIDCEGGHWGDYVGFTGWLQEQLQFPVIRRRLVRYANEETVEREVVYGVEVTVCGRTGVFEAVIEPAKRYGLLGAIVLEALDLIADPRSQRLYVNPRSPDLPMAEIE